MKLFPKSIVGRTALVLLVGLTISHIISLAIYSDDRRTELTSFGGQQISRRIAAAVETIDRTEPERKADVTRSLWGPGFSLTLTQQSAVTMHDARGWRARGVRETLSEYLDGYDKDRIRVAYVHLSKTMPGLGADPDRDGDPLVAMQRHMGQMMAGTDSDSHRRFNFMSRSWHGPEVLKVSARLSDGQWLNVAAPAIRFSPFWRSRMFGPIFFIGLLVIALSFWAVRRATAPLALFEVAAERLGRDVNAPPMNEEGPREVRRAAKSFNNMQRRLKAFVDGRTHMLAAISHDLRTPITRLRLRAELIEDEEQQKKILDDLAQMENMIVATLAFARDETASEADVRLDLAALLQSLTDDAADSGSKTSYQGPDKLTCTGRPVALMRAFQNLIDNAIKYGGRADVGVVQDDHGVTVHIDDAGPGIPEAERVRVFDPFYRIEGSRNRETGGVGLGLAVVQSVVNAHGGNISFGPNDSGGFRVTVTLPAYIAETNS